MNRISRKVNNDSTVSIDGIYYDSPLQFMRMKVEIRYLPDDMEHAYIMKGNFFPFMLPIKSPMPKPSEIIPISLTVQKLENNHMFKSHYGLSFNPFDKHNLKEKDCFLSSDHKEMTSRLNYLKDVRGIGVFTAPPGMGKSYALRCFSKDLNPNLFEVHYIFLCTVSVSEFYRQFFKTLGIDVTGGKTGMFQAIQQRVYYLYKDKCKPLILAVDEAQYLNAGILRNLKMLMNHGYDSLNCFSPVLVGEPYLNSILEKPVHEALRQRITVHYNFERLTDSEVADYLKHKLYIASASESILAQGCISAIHGFSRDNPRLIDNLMTDALTLGCQLDKKTIDSEIILSAIKNQALH